MAIIKSKYIVKNGERYAPTEGKEYFKIKKKAIAAKENYFAAFADEFIAKGSVIIEDGGLVLSSVKDLPQDLAYAVLIGKELYLAPTDYQNLSPSCYINHNCQPNIARIGALTYVAIKDIKRDQEITIDYAPLVAGIDDWQMKCNCNSKNCRKLITGKDWQNKELAQKLWPYWLAHIQREIIKNKIL